MNRRRFLSALLAAPVALRLPEGPVGIRPPARRTRAVLVGSGGVQSPPLYIAIDPGCSAPPLVFRRGPYNRIELVTENPPARVQWSLWPDTTIWDDQTITVLGATPPPPNVNTPYRGESRHG